MENTSKHTSPISQRDIAYYRRRHQNRVFSEFAKFFANEAESGRITRKEIATMLGKAPSQITRWLSSPSNLELDTISDLLLVMGAEMDHCVVRFIDRAIPNYAHPVFIGTSKAATNASQLASFKRQIERVQSINEKLEMQTHEGSGTTQSVISEVTLHATV